jgi:hypothetical protein
MRLWRSLRLRDRRWPVARSAGRVDEIYGRTPGASVPRNSDNNSDVNRREGWEGRHNRERAMGARSIFSHVSAG